ncbi:MAG TPA: hypothetical protein VLO11_09725, partial [Luteolibacter sp.]|nr:hypothetical protein [Luteolibacter sp.]
MKMKQGVISAAIVWSQLFLSGSTVGQNASDLENHHDPATGITVLRATVTLPGPGHWTVEPTPGKDASLSDVFLTGHRPDQLALGGRRMARRAREEALRQDGMPLRLLEWAIRRHSDEHNGNPPASLDELGDNLDKETRKKLVERYHVLKDLSIDLEQAPDKARIVAFETKPVFEDGKHWVLLSNAMADRRQID